MTIGVAANAFFETKTQPIDV